MRILVAAAGIWFSLALGAAEYQRRLVPVTVVGAPGAYGTRWTTRVIAVQELEDGTEIVGDMSLDIPPGLGGSQPYRVFPLPSENEPPGSILYVPKDFATLVHISAQVEQTGPTANEPAVLPVVSEEEFVGHTLYFPQLTKDSRERLHLRVYSLDLEHPIPAVRVRVQANLASPMTGWTFVYDEVHLLSALQKFTTSLENGGGNFALRPLSSQLSLDHILTAVPEGADLAVSVMPASENLRIWAMLSETNNTTQRVRVLLPE